eukprot:3941551-Prymnesium_polylepis.1
MLGSIFAAAFRLSASSQSKRSRRKRAAGVAQEQCGCRARVRPSAGRPPLKAHDRSGSSSIATVYWCR